MLFRSTFYDGVEIELDLARVKYDGRAARFNPFLAFVMTVVETFLLLVFFILETVLTLRVVRLIIWLFDKEGRQAAKEKRQAKMNLKTAENAVI